MLSLSKMLSAVVPQCELVIYQPYLNIKLQSSLGKLFWRVWGHYSLVGGLGSLQPFGGLGALQPVGGLGALQPHDQVRPAHLQSTQPCN